MNELKFLMTTKLIEKYNDRMREFFEVIQEYVEKVHDGEFTGITEISYAGINYTWKKTTGCRGHYTTVHESAYANYSAILEILLKQGETK